MKPATKLETLRRYMAEGDWPAALKLAASFPRLGAHRDVIQRGWEAYARPGLYRQMGRDPDALVRAGIHAIRERYEAKHD